MHWDFAHHHAHVCERSAQRKLNSMDYAGCRLIRRVRRALVEYHHDVGIEYALNPHRLLRREKTRIAIHRRSKLDPLLGDLSQHAQAEYLKTTGICQDGPSQPIKRCRPPCASITSRPGRSHK